MLLEGSGDLNTNDGSQKDGGSGEQPAWLAQVTDDLKGSKDLTQFKTISDLGKSYLELSEKSKGYIKPLGEKPTPEEAAKFRKSIGVPEKAEDYKVEKPEKMPEGMVHDDVLEKKFRETSHQLNLTPSQVAGIYKMYSDYSLGINEDLNKDFADEKQKAVDTLKDIWKGSAYEENTAKAIRSFHKFAEASNPPEAFGGVEGIKQWVEQNGMGNDPVMVWLFSKTFELIGDDKFIKGAPAGAGKDILDEMFPSMAKK